MVADAPRMEHDNENKAEVLCSEFTAMIAGIIVREE